MPCTFGDTFTVGASILGVSLSFLYETILGFPTGWKLLARWDHLLTRTGVSVKRSISSLRRINNSPLDGLNSISLALLWLRSSNIAPVEEAHEEVHQWSEIKDIQPSREGLPLSIEAVNRAVSRDGLLHLSRGLTRLANRLRKTLSTSSSINNALHSIPRSLSSGSVANVLSGINDNALDGGDWDIVGDEAVGGGVVDTDYELADLEGCEGLLDGFWDADAEGGYGVVRVLSEMLAGARKKKGYEVWSEVVVVSIWGGRRENAYHHSVNTRVQEAEEPDSWSHVAHTSPHAHHRTSVVVSLESRRSLALSQDNNSIDDLVKFGKVEEPSIESKTLVPETPAGGQRSGRDISLASSGRHPLLSRRIVCDGVAKSRWTMELAKAVNDPNDSLRSRRRWDSSLKPLPHADERPSRVDGKENVVQDDDPVEGAGLGDGPGLVAARGVDLV